MAQTATVRPAAQARLNTFLAQVYLLMVLGLVVTAVVATGTANNLTLLTKIAFSPWLSWGLIILQFVVVIALSAAATRMAPGAAVILFLLYSALTGLVFSSLFMVYTSEDISSIFWIAAGMFLVTSVVGLVMKRDMSSGGNVLMMLLFGWIIAWCFSFFFPKSNFNWALNFIGVILFVGLTAWDSQRLKQLGVQLADRAPGGLVVIGALTLYLDFINLFLLLLRTSRR
jgi:uncharacterized protein